MAISLVLTILLNCLHFGQQTSVFYPSNSAYGLFAAIAVPLDLPHRNVFMSYNFEANYNMPPFNNTSVTANTVGFFGENDYFVGKSRQFNNETLANRDNYKSNSTKSKKRRSAFRTPYTKETEEEEARQPPTSPLAELLTRKHFYEILANKFQSNGYEGEACLLRLICEVNYSEMGQINGVLGNLIHIMFSPTTSRAEQHLPLKYYQAEVDGNHGNCNDYYSQSCPENPMDLFSTPISQIIEQILNHKQ